LTNRPVPQYFFDGRVSLGSGHSGARLTLGAERTVVVYSKRRYRGRIDLGSPPGGGALRTGEITEYEFTPESLAWSWPATGRSSGDASGVDGDVAQRFGQ
jgi:hypothetical protein